MRVQVGAGYSDDWDICIDELMAVDDQELALMNHNKTVQRFLARFRELRSSGHYKSRSNIHFRPLPRLNPERINSCTLLQSIMDGSANESRDIMSTRCWIETISRGIKDDRFDCWARKLVEFYKARRSIVTNFRNNINNPISSPTMKKRDMAPNHHHVRRKVEAVTHISSVAPRKGV